MAVNHIDDSLIIGTDYELQLEFTDDDGELVTIVLSEYDADLVSTLGGDVITSFTLDDDDSNTTLYLKLANDNAGLASFSGDKLYWDLLRTDGDIKTVFMRGRLTVIDKISDGEEEE